MPPALHDKRAVRPGTFAYADSPYLGCCGLYDHYHPDGRCWDDPETHRLLFERLNRDYPDGWAWSGKNDATELRMMTGWAEADGGKVRLGSWVKPFHVFKPNVNPSYGWEPLMWKGGRHRGRDLPTVPDFLVCNITLQKGLTGAKPPEFARWVFQLLGMRRGDTFVDLYPGTGAMGTEWEKFTRPQPTLTVGNLEVPK